MMRFYLRERDINLKKNTIDNSTTTLDRSMADDDIEQEKKPRQERVRDYKISTSSLLSAR
jgi:hypothetical protein